MPVKKFTVIEKNSNSWHITRVKAKIKYVEDNQETEYFRIIDEFDVPLGDLEDVIITYGIDSLMDNETATLFLKLFPAPA